MNINPILGVLKAELNRITKAIAALEALFSTAITTARRGRPAASKAAPKPRRKRRLTAAGRTRLSEMMKKRWAERRQKAAKPAPKKSRGHRVMSAAARRKIAAAQKKRWAAVKKAAPKAVPKKSSSKPGAKKLVKAVGGKKSVKRPTAKTGVKVRAAKKTALASSQPGAAASQAATAPAQA